MKQINIYKAQPATKAGNIESVTINIHESLPEKVYADLDEWRAVALKEATALADALCDSLPQGVTDALLAVLLERKRSLFIIPMAEPVAGGRYHVDKDGIAHHPEDCYCMSCTRKGL